MSIAPQIPKNIVKDTNIIFNNESSIELKLNSNPKFCMDDGNSQTAYPWECIQNNNQRFIYNSVKKQIIDPNKNLCLDVDMSNKMTWSGCNPSNLTQQYAYNPKTNQIKNTNYNLCMDINTNTVGNGSSSFILNQCSNSVNQQFTPNLMSNAMTNNKNNIINTINNNITTINNYLNARINTTNIINNDYNNYNNEINNELNNKTPYNNMENAFNDINNYVIQFYNETAMGERTSLNDTERGKTAYNNIITKLNYYNNKIEEYNNYVSNIEKLRRKSNYLSKYVPLFNNDINSIKSLLNQQSTMINSINSEPLININNDYMNNKINYSNKLVTDALNINTKFDILYPLYMQNNITDFDKKNNISLVNLGNFGIYNPWDNPSNGTYLTTLSYNNSMASKKSGRILEKKNCTIM